MITVEQTPNFNLPDSDFAKILTSETDSLRALKWGLSFFEVNGLTTTAAPDTATVTFNLSKKLVADVVPNNNEYRSMSPQQLSEHLRNLTSSKQVLADAHAWFTINNHGTIDMAEITTIVINHARSLVRNKP